MSVLLFFILTSFSRALKPRESKRLQRRVNGRMPHRAAYPVMVAALQTLDFCFDGRSTQAPVASGLGVGSGSASVSHATARLRNIRNHKGPQAPKTTMELGALACENSRLDFWLMPVTIFDDWQSWSFLPITRAVGDHGDVVDRGFQIVTLAVLAILAIRPILCAPCYNSVGCKQRLKEPKCQTQCTRKTRSTDRQAAKRRKENRASRPRSTCRPGPRKTSRQGRR